MLGVTLFGLMLTPVFYVVLRTLAGGKIHVAQKDISHEIAHLSDL
jgi:multidrug efflux pump